MVLEFPLPPDGTLTRVGFPMEQTCVVHSAGSVLIVELDTEDTPTLESLRGLMDDLAGETMPLDAVEQVRREGVVEFAWGIGFERQVEWTSEDGTMIVWGLLVAALHAQVYLSACFEREFDETEWRGRFDRIRFAEAEQD